MAIDISNLSLEQLKRAVSLKEQIEALGNELASILGPTSTPAAPGKRVVSEATRAKMRAAHQARLAKKGVKAPQAAKRKGKMSAAGRAAIVAAQKARWAKIKAAKTPPPAKPVQKPKPRLSAAGRAAIIAATKARWAKVKAGKK